jgi:transposase
MDRMLLEVWLGEGLSLEEIGRRVGLHASTVGYWVKKHELEAVNRERHAAKGGIGREELEALVGAGATIAELAAAVGMSKATVRHWLGRYGLSTKNGTGRRKRAEAIELMAEGQTRGVLTCARHGQTEFRLEGRNVFRCCRCRAEAVARRRRKVKSILVAEAGGRCVVCGYGGNPHALHFHHVEPSEKDFALSRDGVTRSLARARAEAAKCVLLCANCHAGVEAAVIRLP